MNDAKEFHGKTLDEAISAACEFYGVEREKLEIEIVNDSKMGIFGLVNVKKACVRASLASTPLLLEGLTETLTESLNKTEKPKPKPKKAVSGNGKADKAKSGKPLAKPEAKAAAKPAGKPVKHEEAINTATKSGTTVKSENKGEDTPAEETDAPKKDKSPRKNDTKGNRKGKPADRKNSVEATAPADTDEEASEGFSLADLESLDQAELHATVNEVVSKLVTAIIGEVPLAITIDEGHIRVKVDCEEDARILVGREGQTLSSVQYIASRILASRLNGAVRLHIDTGNYKENQDARLTSLAQMLAEKLRKTGRTQSTRPLSAHQRRIVHLALEGEEDIQTSSKGDGPQRRVLIHFKRSKPAKPEAVEAEPSPPLDGTAAE